jgi:hypothetical protein
LTGLLLLAMRPFVLPAFGSPDPLSVRLGNYRFGHLSKPEAIVARVGPKGVAFENPPEGAANGPWSFDVGADGSIYLLDQFNYRVLVWDPARPDRVARMVSLSKDDVQIAADMAVGPDGTIYLSYIRESHPEGLSVLALGPTGKMLWTTPLGNVTFNSVLRIGPDGRLYWAPGLGTDHFRPVTTSGGKPLSVAEQRARALALEPAPEGGTFEEDGVIDPKTDEPRETRFVYRDADGSVIGAWSITTDKPTGLGANAATPGQVDGDPVVTLYVWGKSPPDTAPPSEYVVLRLAPDGVTRTRLALDTDAFWGDSPITGLRLGPDGAFYQLRSDIDTGVSIARYSLAGRATPPSETPAVTRTVSPSKVVSPTNRATRSASVSIVAAPASPVASSSSHHWIAPLALILVGLAILAGMLLFWRRSADSRS